MDSKFAETISLSVIMPVFNERFTLREIVHRVVSQSEVVGGLELVIVDDGSSDGSREIIEDLTKNHIEIIPIFHEKNSGKAEAIRSGIKKARGEIILIQDADLEYDPREYSRLLRPIKEGVADVVYGSRFLVSEYRRVLYFWHYLMNTLLTTFSNMCTNLTLTDMETCFKVFRGPLLRSIPLRSNGFGLEPELTAKIAKRNLRIYEVPISYSGRTYEEGKKISWKDGLWAIYYILKYFIIDDCYFEGTAEEILYTISLAPRFNRWMADTIRPHLGNSVLEIGAGIGNMTTQLLPRDNYIASEMNLDSLATLRSRFGSNKIADIRKIDVSETSDFDGLNEKMDSIVCLNVLEHVADDQKALANLFTTLKPGGKLVLLTPQNPFLFGSLDMVAKHFRRYSRSSLSQLLTNAGFEVESFFDFNRPGVLPWFVSGRILRRKTLGKFSMKTFEHFVWLFRRIDNLLPWQGLSIIAVAKKPLCGQ